MISCLTGSIIAIQENCITLNINGIGLEVHTPRARTYTLNSSITLLTVLTWSQEQGPSLFGFAHEYERALFTLVTSAPGIGPKMGILMLSNLDPATIVHAISSDDAKILSSINGIGPKKAQHLILHLKDKMKDLTTAHQELSTHQTYAWADLQNALTALGYSKAEIASAQHHLKAHSAQQSFDLLLRAALHFLAKRSS